MEEQEPKSAILEKIQKMDDAEWKKWQIGGGILLGLLVCAVLFLLQTTATFGSINFLIAGLIALLVPRWLEKKLEREIRKGRLALIFTLLAGVVWYGVYLYFTVGFGG